MSDAPAAIFPSADKTELRTQGWLPPHGSIIK
jgi:hypothetical protein